MAGTKIATCCYCGTRATLILRGRERHELSCGTCGAPLRKLKMLPLTATPALTQRPAGPVPVQRKVARPKKRRKGKSLGHKVFSELWDIIEDVFD
ncbi:MULTISPECIES: hypothetical protein [unclassified Yoonia]|uniref:hypothetical protein n=1 Tax=unclassified Yoonia TaxID=2629118 RepID=UPI002AFDF559|nr:MULTISPECIES: hypothetical protein [unclassified Yoonia]